MFTLWDLDISTIFMLTTTFIACGSGLLINEYTQLKAGNEQLQKICLKWQHQRQKGLLRFVLRRSIALIMILWLTVSIMTFLIAYFERDVLSMNIWRISFLTFLGDPGSLLFMLLYWLVTFGSCDVALWFMREHYCKDCSKGDS